MLLEKAIQIAAAAHSGVKDKAGAPYVLHPLRLMMKMNTEAEMIAAVLHDVVEDSDWTIERLRSEGFPEEVLEAVDSLTRRSDESYEEFVIRAGRNPIARRVKLADLEDNMNMLRMRSIPEKDVERLKRYHTAWHVLMEEA
jgi:(p)ppGpp synthase/HD superfamily hydrolase